MNTSGESSAERSALQKGAGVIWGDKFENNTLSLTVLKVIQDFNMRKKWSGQIAIQHIYLGLTNKNSANFFIKETKL